MKDDRSAVLGSARGSRADFGGLAEIIWLRAPETNEVSSSQWRGRHCQHASRLRSPEPNHARPALSNSS